MLSFTKCEVEMPAFMVGSNSGTTRNIPIRMGRSPSIMFVKIGNYFISCIIGSFLVFNMVGEVNILVIIIFHRDSHKCRAKVHAVRQQVAADVTVVTLERAQGIHAPECVPNSAVVKVIFIDILQLFIFIR